MNWILVALTVIVAVLVPAALLVTFLTTKDTYTYAEHYGEHGFSQEVQRPASAESVPSASLEPQPQAHGTQQDPPVTEWPREL